MGRGTCAVMTAAPEAYCGRWRSQDVRPRSRWCSVPTWPARYEKMDRAAMPLPEAVARTHPDGIDVLVDVASDAGQFAALAGHVRADGTALTTRYVADQETLARAGVTGVNFALSMTVPLLDRLASRVAAGSVVPPPITRVSLDDVPALLGRHAEGKPSSRCGPGRTPDAAPAPPADAAPLIPARAGRKPKIGRSREGRRGSWRSAAT
jgi:hypothetical protein